jgi:hypothetical protein
MSTKAEIITIKCANDSCVEMADVVTVGPHETSKEWNTLPPGWFERLGTRKSQAAEPFHPRTFVCSRSCLLGVLEHEAYETEPA